MRQAGVRRIALLTDEDPSGRALATNLGAKAHAAGIAVVAREEIDEHALRHDDAIARIGEARAGCGARRDRRASGRGAPVARAARGRSADCSCSRRPTSPMRASSPASAPRRPSRTSTQPVYEPTAGGPSAQRFVRAFTRRYGRDPGGAGALRLRGDAQRARRDPPRRGAERRGLRHATGGRARVLRHRAARRRARALRDRRRGRHVAATAGARTASSTASCASPAGCSGASAER